MARLERHRRQRRRQRQHQRRQRQRRQRNGGSGNASSGSANASSGSANASSGSANASSGSANASSGSANASSGSANASSGSANASGGSASGGSANASGGAPFTLVFAPADAATRADPWFVRVTDYPGVGSQLAGRSPVVLVPGAALTRGLRTLVADGTLDDAAVGMLGGRRESVTDRPDRPVLLQLAAVRPG